MRYSVIVLSPVVIAIAIIMTIATLFREPSTALFMAYIIGYALIAIFLYFYFTKSNEKEE